jgi:PAS domain S-box-containing protein
MTRHGALRLTLIYALIAGSWIFLSDLLLFDYLPAFFDTRLGSILKGLFFILVTSALLYALAQRYLRAEQELRLASVAGDTDFLRLKEFFAALPVVAYVLETRDGIPTPVWISENVERLLGYSRDETLDPDWWRTHLHDEDVTRAALEHARIVKEGGGEHRYRFVGADGETRHVRDELRPLPNGPGGKERWLGVWTSMDQQQKNEAELRRYADRLEGSITATVGSIARLTELRDPYTAGHEQRVGEIAAAIAAEMGLDAQFQEGLRVAGSLHDIGKIGVPAEILIKPSRLSASEFKLVKEHPQYGHSILKDIDFPWPVADTALQHHERMDGSGYPQGLKGEDICLEARIVAVADVIESMAFHRPYRPSLGVDAALEEVERGSGRLYDPAVSSACLRLFREKAYVLPE